jgi:hypothetical protein
MTIPEKYDRVATGVISGLLLPFIIALLMFLFAKGDHNLQSWLKRIAESDIVTHIITLCVFPNILIFLLFNHFDMLRASRGVLAITILWAVLVFGVKFLL